MRLSRGEIAQHEWTIVQDAEFAGDGWQLVGAFRVAHSSTAEEEATITWVEDRPVVPVIGLPSAFGGTVFRHARAQCENTDGGEKIHCIVAHPYGLLREGVRRLLQDQSDFEVVGEAGNAAELLRLVSEHQPDVVIADAQALALAAPELERVI